MTTSMTIRKMALPIGWYPHTKDGVLSLMEDYKAAGAIFDGRDDCCAVISPHAGWFFAGSLIAKSLSALTRDCGTIIIAGGHLGAGSPVLFAEEDAVQTPLGVLNIDVELREAIKKNIKINVGSDTYHDNTVEVILPAVHYFFRDAKIIWMRVPADMTACETGRIIAETVKTSAGELKRNVAMIASTDLTHYGSNYDYAPVGSGAAALNWVKQVNDKRFIDAVLNYNVDEVLLRAEEELSACSAGAVLCALSFAKELGGNVTAELLDYTTSADAMLAAGEKEIPDSFVGYASVVINKKE